MNDVAALSRTLLAAAYDVKASDVHFSPFLKEAHIYFRVNGKRIFYQKILIDQYKLLLTYYKFTSNMDIGEIRKPQNGIITDNMKNNIYSLRLSTLPVNQMESLAIRILPQEENLDLNHLFLFPNQLNNLKKWITNRAGLILLSGPTGSGKTTTLYALLESVLKDNSYQAITLEDPIEKPIKDILQVQINEKAGISYQTGLKAALRHDPDIIMIGEIRDKYTAAFAFEASLTGHLVLSTLHAKNTFGTIHRLLDMGLKPSELYQSLIGIASLELVPVLQKSREIKRAAIMELLDGTLLEDVILERTPPSMSNFQSFHYLRKKALAYGFITSETYYLSEK